MSLALNTKQIRHDVSNAIFMAKAMLHSLSKSPKEAEDYCKKGISILENIIQTIDKEKNGNNTDRQVRYSFIGNGDITPIKKV